MNIHALGFLLILGVIQALAKSTALDYIVDSEVLFAQNFSHAIYTYNNNTNVVCSPLSSYLLLAQASFGADGNTANQLRKVLDLPNEHWNNFLLRGFKSLRAQLQTIKNVSLYTANRLIIYQDLELNEIYSNSIKNSFDSEIKPFTGSAAALANDVNSWVDSKTNHKINKVINPDDIDEQKTKLILLNAVYYGAKWLVPFNKRNTKLYEFTDLNQTTHKVPTMLHIKKSFDHGKLNNIDANYIELPYTNTDFKMVIIVHNKDSITEAEFNELGDELKKFSYKQLPKTASSSEVTLSLPKFKIESIINLEPVLKAMKADEMFTSKANFKKLIKNQDVDLQITKILQKVVINVNEMGTEAAAASFVEYVAMSSDDLINVNVPFYFLIESSQGVLFQGRVLLPNYK